MYKCNKCKYRNEKIVFLSTKATNPINLVDSRNIVVDNKNTQIRRWKFGSNGSLGI